jgi:hypothetical protein
MESVISTRDFASSTHLRVTGIDLDPTLVSELLALEPDTTWRRGDAKRVGNGVHEWGGWKKRLAGQQAGDPLAQDLRLWLTLLDGRQTVLRDLRASGSQVVVDCFISVSSAALIELDAELLREFSSLGIKIEIAIWGNAAVNDLPR